MPPFSNGLRDLTESDFGSAPGLASESVKTVEFGWPIGMPVCKPLGDRTNHSGSTFDSFLEEEGIREEVEAVAIKRVLA
ncbi:MAG TPA: hypothetical protein VKH45_07215 [Candidatus Acidoferrum sp.]|nr:hypothetical protein [Candidatus Acidoferrum sp.]